MNGILIALSFFFGLFGGDSAYYIAEHRLFRLEHQVFWSGACWWAVTDAKGVVESGSLPGGATRAETDTTPGLYCYAGGGTPAMLQAWSSTKDMPGVWHWLPLVVK